MADIVLFKKERQTLGEVAFVRSITDQTKIRDIKDSYSISKEIAHWLAFTTNMLGIKEAVPMHNKAEITELILTVFKNLSFDELYYAYKLERFGTLGDKTEHYQLFNSSYVSDVLRKYVNWKQELRRKHNLELAKKQEAPIISEEEKRRLINQGVVRCFNEFTAQGVISPGNMHIYDVLYEDGFLPTDVESKKKIYEEAKEVLRFQVESKEAISIQEKEHFKKILSATEKKRDSIVVAEAKKLSMRKFFRELTREEPKRKEFLKKYNI